MPPILCSGFNSRANGTLKRVRFWSAHSGKRKQNSSHRSRHSHREHTHGNSKAILSPVVLTSRSQRFRSTAVYPTCRPHPPPGRIHRFNIVRHEKSAQPRAVFLNQKFAENCTGFGFKLCLCIKEKLTVCPDFPPPTTRATYMVCTGCARHGFTFHGYTTGFTSSPNASSSRPTRWGTGFG